MCSVSFAAVCMPIPMLCTSVCTLGPSVWSPQLFGLSGVRFAAPIGKSGGFVRFQGILTISGIFAGLFAFV